MSCTTSCYQSKYFFQRGRYLKPTNPSCVRAVWHAAPSLSPFHHRLQQARSPSVPWPPSPATSIGGLQRDSRAAPERNAPKRYSMWHLRRKSRHPQADGWKLVFHQENWDIMEEWGQKYIHCNCIWKYKGYYIIYPEGTSVQKEDYQKQPGWKKC